MIDLYNYHRRRSHAVQIGHIALGGDNPVRVQSMTTTDTNDTAASVAQVKRIVDAGGELVRLTTQGRREAKALEPIHAALRAEGYDVPLVADVHFNANVADIAAELIEKVRINPGNYVDPGRTFKQLVYTPESYAEELARLEERFVKLLDICKAHGTALRIGVNHGSLSDRIMSHYGDTPEGIVESCMEFLRVCVKHDFHRVVISIKASNTVVMVRAMRLLVTVMEREGMTFPLHLGVTEAGEGEDGRIKSAAGIGALLADGIGDTLRVSLSEDPECEIPVGKHLADYVAKRAGHLTIPGRTPEGFNYTAPERRPTKAVSNIGGNRPPVVVVMALTPEAHATLTQATTKPDYIYCGQALPAEADRIKGVGYIVDADLWQGEANTYPAFPHNYLMFLGQSKAPLKFLFVTYGALTDEVKACLRLHPEVVVIAQSNHDNRVGEHRAFVHELQDEGITNPVVIFQYYQHQPDQLEVLQLEAAADTGALVFDGLCDGLFLFEASPTYTPEVLTQTSFAILQATRARTTKTEYISCPGCGRTLYDLQSTVARVKASTSEFAHLKIAVMGCIVNGPGEMADADYGYVGSGPGKISLYRGKECVAKNINTEDAVERLLALIRADEAKAKAEAEA